MTKQTEAMKLALEALRSLNAATTRERIRRNTAINALREALAEQPAQIAGFDVVLDESMPPNTMKFDKPAQQEPVATLKDEVIGCFDAAFVEGLQEALAETQDERLKDLVERRLMYALYAARDTSPPAQQEPVAWCPDVCPITGLPFFMWIEHHETGQNVPTYGGPYDSYTIPVRDKDGSYCRERYDHDRGGWLTDEVEDVGIQIVSDQAYVSDNKPPASNTLTDEEIEAASLQAGMQEHYMGFHSGFIRFARAIEAAIKENQ